MSLVKFETNLVRTLHPCNPLSDDLPIPSLKESNISNEFCPILFD